MHLLTTLATALSTLNLLSHVNAYKWDDAAAKFAKEDIFSDMAPLLEGSWGQLKVDENGECFIALNQIYNCNGRSDTFATYNSTTGYCDAFDGADPMTAPICGGYLWFYGQDYKDTRVPTIWSHENITKGDLYLKSKRREVNLLPYHIGKAGCGFAPVYLYGEYQYLKEDCGLVRKPVGKWTG